MFTILDYLEESARKVPQNVFCEDFKESVSFKEFPVKNSISLPESLSGLS